MNQKTLEIFELCERLAELLGDKETIADLQILLERHPEMFKDRQEVKEMVKKIVSKPDIAVDANRDKREYSIIKVAKILNEEKMGDVVIKNQDGTNKIFHANEKRIREFDRLKNKENLLQVETPIPSTHQLNGLELMNENPSGEKTLSVKDRETIPQLSQESQTEALVRQILQKQESINAMLRASEILNNGEGNEVEQKNLQNKQEQRLKQRFRK